VILYDPTRAADPFSPPERARSSIPADCLHSGVVILRKYGCDPMVESISLRDASVQDIQLELLRRTSFNGLDGGKVGADLLKHRELWLAVLLDRPGVPNYLEPGLLLTSGLIKLRDLPDDFWNADTLFILTPTRQAAKRLGAIAKEWGGEICVYKDQSEIDRALGTGREKFGLLSVWWD
jgi:hypothetical protein